MREVARAYGLDPSSVEPVASAYRPDAAFRAGTVLLKPYRYGERQLYYVVRGLRHLEQRGCRAVPRLVPALSGEPYVRAGKRLWYATTWIVGRRPRWPFDLEAAARSLAAFHRASEGCFMPYGGARSWSKRWPALLADLLAFRRQAADGKSPFDQEFFGASAVFVEQAKAATAALRRSAYAVLEADCRQRRAFCHRDVTTANMVADARGQVWLVDPDTWGPELRVYDLARLVLAGAGDDPARALRAVRTYAAALPLDPRELRLLPWAYLLPREYWWAGVCRYRRPAPGVDPGALLRQAVAGAGARAACALALSSEL